MTQHHDSSKSHHFIVPVAYYVKTFIALLILTVVTVAAAQVNFGALNVPIALFIAIVKAALVCFVFMGLRWDKGVNGVFFFGSFVFLGIFIAFTLSDISFRPTTDIVEGPRFGFKQPKGIIQEHVEGSVAPVAHAEHTVPTASVEAGK